VSEAPVPEEHLDESDLALRGWVAQDRIEGYVRDLSTIYELDPELGERLADAARDGDEDELLEALADLLSGLE
jgi:hypothetical protein